MKHDEETEVFIKKDCKRRLNIWQLEDVIKPAVFFDKNKYEIKNLEELKTEEDFVKFDNFTFKSTLSVMFNVVNCLIRYTILELPVCFIALGIVNAIGFIFLVAIICVISTKYVLRIYEITGEKAYIAFAFKWWGNKGKIVILILNFLNSFGYCLSYVIVTMKAFNSVLSRFLTLQTDTRRYHLHETIALFIILSFLSLSTDAKKLTKAAYYGFYAIIYLVIMLFCMLIYNGEYDTRIDDNAYFEYNYLTINTNFDITNQLAVIILSFSYHSYIFSIYDTLYEPTTEKMVVASNMGILFSALVYVCVGGSLYITFGTYIVNSLGIYHLLSQDNFGIFINIFFCISVSMSFPISFFSLKAYAYFAINIIREYKSNYFSNSNSSQKDINKLNNQDKEELKSQEQESKLSIDPNDEFNKNNEKEEIKEKINHPEELSYWVKFIVACLLYITIFISCYYISNIKYIFGFLGSIVANLNSFILPSLFYIKFSEHQLMHRNNVFPVLLTFSGIAFMIICNIFTLRQLLN